ncbi:hypothetical protein [Mesorhizobium sp. M0037]|uniref:hypothetical protein n=1 Tax=unclassified Mesorhizobium TaxID=325217 RepID=UPI00333A4A69
MVLSVPGTLVPEHFLPALGFVDVRQTQMDRAVNLAIGHLAGLDHSALIALLSPVKSLGTRLDMLERLIPLRTTTTNDRAKLEVIRREVALLNGDRNRLIHDLPYGYSPSEDAVILIKAETWTDPQVKISPPKSITTDWLYELGNNMLQAEIWLGMPFHSNGVGVEPHPNWLDDAEFPWPDKLEKLLRDLEKSAPTASG